MFPLALIFSILISYCGFIVYKSILWVLDKRKATTVTTVAEDSTTVTTDTTDTTVTTVQHRCNTVATTEKAIPARVGDARFTSTLTKESADRLEWVVIMHKKED